MQSLLALIALATPLAAATQDKGPASVGNHAAGQPIVITGARLPDLRKALQACLARNCPPDQDIDATLAVAESQFIGGDYRGARVTIGKSIARNRRYASTYPVAVSDLLRADSRVSAHLGDRDRFRFRSYDAVTALKAGLSNDDPRVISSRIEVGDMLVRIGRIDEAIEAYRDVERDAANDGLAMLSGLARLRMVSLFTQLATISPSDYLGLARKNAAVLTDNTDPAMKPFAQAAHILMAKLDARNGDPTAINRLIADLPRTKGGATPVLIYAPPVKTQPEPPTPFIKLGAGRGARTNYDGEWVDIGFWVAPDGRVTDADIYRSGNRQQQPDWAIPILEAIRGRRYAQLDMAPSLPGILRIERYTWTAWRTTNTGSRIVTREPQPVIEMLDLSVDLPAPPPPKD